MNKKYLIWFWTWSVLGSSNSKIPEQATTGSSSSEMQQIVANPEGWSMPREPKWVMIGTGEEIRQTICRNPDQAFQNFAYWIENWKSWAKKPGTHIWYQKICEALKDAVSLEECFTIVCNEYPDFLIYLDKNQDDTGFSNPKAKPSFAEVNEDTEWELIYQRMTLNVKPSFIREVSVEPKNDEIKNKTT